MASETKKINPRHAPPELLERIKTYYFDRKQVSEITGLSVKSLANLACNGVVKPEYFIISNNAYYSYTSIIEVFLVKKIKEYNKPFTTLKHARKALERIGKGLTSIVSKQVVLYNGELYFIDKSKLGNLVYSLSKKNCGEIMLNIFDFSEIDNEMTESFKNHHYTDIETRKKYAYS